MTPTHQLRGRMRPRTTFLLAAAAFSVGAVSGTQAATISTEGGALVFRAAPGETNDLYVNDEGTNVVFGDEVAAVFPSGLCTSDPYLPGYTRCVPQPGGVRVELGDRDDVARLGSGWAPGTPITIDGGDGDDRLTGYQGSETLLGGGGNDVLEGAQGDDRLFGGPGDDVLSGGDGTDEVRGEEGDDLVGGGGTANHADVIDGGPGRDTLDQYEYSGAPAGAASVVVHITIGAGADDGRPGERDDVTGVEVAMLLVPADITPAAGPVEFSVFRTTPAGSTLRGTDLADSLTGFDFDDVIVGGAGDDTIVGGYGDDTINPGPGRDSVNADTAAACNFFECRPPQGNDTIDARDGEVDAITCGVGEDRVLADPVDVVAADCETVVRSSAPADRPADADQPSTDAPITKPGVSVPARWTAAAVRRGTKLKVTVPSAGRITLALIAGKGRSARTLATGKATAKSAGTPRVALRVRQGQSRRVRRGTYRLRVRFTPSSGASSSVTVPVKLR